MKLVIFTFILILISCSSNGIQEIDDQPLDDIIDSKVLTDDTDSVIHYVRAHRSLETKNLSYAESRFKKVVEIEPNFARGWLGLAEVSILKNNFDDASKYLDEALSLKPDLYEAVYFKGVLLNYQNKCEDFIDIFEKIDKTPINRLNLLLSNCYLELKKTNEAKIFFDYSNKYLVEDYDLVAEHYYLKGDYLEAKEIIDKNPLSYKDPKYLLLISNISIEEGNIDEARKQALEVIEISKQPKIPLYIQEGQKLINEIDIILKD